MIYEIYVVIRTHDGPKKHVNPLCVKRHTQLSLLCCGPPVVLIACILPTQNKTLAAAAAADAAAAVAAVRWSIVQEKRQSGAEKNADLFLFAFWFLVLSSVSPLEISGGAFFVAGDRRGENKKASASCSYVGGCRYSACFCTWYQVGMCSTHPTARNMYRFLAFVHLFKCFARSSCHYIDFPASVSRLMALLLCYRLYNIKSKGCELQLGWASRVAIRSRYCNYAN